MIRVIVVYNVCVVMMIFVFCLCLKEYYDFDKYFYRKDLDGDLN